jgi:hypothetical protein
MHICPCTLRDEVLGISASAVQQWFGMIRTDRTTKSNASGAAVVEHRDERLDCRSPVTPAAQHTGWRTERLCNDDDESLVNTILHIDSHGVVHIQVVRSGRTDNRFLHRQRVL